MPGGCSTWFSARKVPSIPPIAPLSPVCAGRPIASEGAAENLLIDRIVMAQMVE